MKTVQLAMLVATLAISPAVHARPKLETRTGYLTYQSRCVSIEPLG